MMLTLVNKPKVRNPLIKRMEGKTVAYVKTTPIILRKGIRLRNNGQIRFPKTTHNIIDGPVQIHGHKVLVHNTVQPE